jgi:glycosyltransferase involved in cell wall biosynthesis
MSVAVDVLVPTLDRARALAEALTSVEQVRAAEPGIELRVHVIDRAGGSAAGVAAARNLAAARGSAPFLALLDDDDRWLAPRLSRAIAVLEDRPEVVAVAGDAELASGGRFWRGSSTDEGRDLIHRNLLLDCGVCTSTVTLRRRDWERAGGMDERLERAEDYEMWLRLTRPGRPIHVLPDRLAWRDDRGDGLSSDPVAMATATLVALDLSGLAPDGQPGLRDRIGRLKAVRAHGMARDGERRAALTLALDAIRHAPGAKVAWTALARALTAGRR